VDRRTACSAIRGCSEYAATSHRGRFVASSRRHAFTIRDADLGCGKGAVGIKIASESKLRVFGIELFEPFVAHATAAARRAGVSRLCEFCHGDAGALTEHTPPADVAVFAALGDVLGSWAKTMRVVPQYVRPGGYVIVADVFLRDGGSGSFAPTARAAVT